MYWSGVQSTGAEIKKYFTKDTISLQAHGIMWSFLCRRDDGRFDAARWVGTGETALELARTIINLLERDLSILWQALLRCVGQHEGFGFLWWCHRGIALREHGHGVVPRVASARSLSLNDE